MPPLQFEDNRIESGESGIWLAKMAAFVIGENGAYSSGGTLSDANTAYDLIFCMASGTFSLTGGNWTSGSSARTNISMTKGQVVPVFGATQIDVHSGALIAKARTIAT